MNMKGILGMPDKHAAEFWGLLMAVIGAFSGRLMWHTEEVQRGNRRFWSKELFWEFPTCLGMAFVGKGAAEWFALNEWAEIGLVATLSYLGPRGLKHLLRLWIIYRGDTNKEKI
ncbi:MAG: phage holin family protein [Terasakiella sp.]|uniref:phage holin family protein n=1 Tax=unclassified Terasakiella TaxID=2614952 RepID=UPI003B0029E7